MEADLRSLAIEPLVSVIVTARNRPELVCSALRSVQLQDFTAWECIVVDDASTDATVQSITAFAAADERFRLIRHPIRRGVSWARNSGLANASADWVCFLDDDDFLLAGSLRHRYELAVTQPADVAAVYSSWTTPEYGVTLDVFETLPVLPHRGELHWVDMINGAGMTISAPLLRRELVGLVGGFDTTYESSEDAELLTRIARLGYRYVPTNVAGSAYRCTPRSLVLGHPLTHLRGRRRVLDGMCQPAPQLAGQGPAPATESLHDILLEAQWATAVMVLLSIAALTDLEGAVERGQATLTVSFRRRLRPEHAEGWATYVCKRCGVVDRQSLDNARATIGELVARLRHPSDGATPAVAAESRPIAIGCSAAPANDSLAEPQRFDDPAPEPLISVIVTSHNRAQLIKAALRSVQLQDFTAWECIVVDDASTDGSVASIEAFVAADPRFRMLRHDTCHGVAQARNTGLAESRAAWVCFLDDDDFLLAGSLAHRYELATSQPADVAGVYCGWTTPQPDVTLAVFDDLPDLPAKEDLYWVGMINGAGMTVTAPLLRRSILESLSGFDTSFVWSADAELLTRIARYGFRFVPTNVAGVAYRCTPGSLLLGSPLRHLDARQQVLAKMCEPAPQLAGFGPAPATESLHTVLLEAQWADAVMVLLCIAALTDLEAAVHEGLQTLTITYRRRLRSEHATAWATYVCKRCGVVDERAKADARAVIHQLVARLQYVIPDRIPMPGGRFHSKAAHAQVGGAR